LKIKDHERKLYYTLPPTVPRIYVLYFAFVYCIPTYSEYLKTNKMNNIIAYLAK